MRHRSRSARGFTLVELIVVIAIITLLMALLAVWIVGVQQRASNANCKAMIQALDEGCKAYKVENNKYPPNDKGDSRNLHYYLGMKRVVVMGRADSGPQITAKKPPLIDFPAGWLKLAKGQIPDPTQPVPVVDPWDNLVRYTRPGKYSAPAPDIWSPGPNSKDDPVPPGGDTDDICNWLKEY
jgi:prepilin-type N-terminal cleavage/methylation domain-containing protein